MPQKSVFCMKNPFEKIQNPREKLGGETDLRSMDFFLPWTWIEVIYPKKIKTQFFDLVIYGCSYRTKPMLSLVLRHYPKNKIVFIDGDDASTIEKELVFRGMYFKRELLQTTHGVFPIAFAAPESIIVPEVPPSKTRLFSVCDPRDRSTYIYKDEKSYYHGYQEALFGVTTKKGGWDALRHYEILANGCVPDFHNIENCPLLTCWNLPKFELLIAQKMAKKCRESQKNPKHEPV